MTDANSIVNQLNATLDGECHTDTLHTHVYSTDASLYQMIPKAVVFPKNKTDIKHVVAFAAKHNIPILARGGATSLAGQAVSTGIIIDFTKYLHGVIEFNANEKWISVEPGITCDEVNHIVASSGLIFAPDPATSSRATIGGMIANNSSGTKSILYGKTIDHVLELEVLLADGTIHEYKSCELDEVKNDALLLHLNELVQGKTNEIKERFPKTMRRVNGYCLDELLETHPWQPHKIFIGSEGTLGIILSAKINLVSLPKHKAIAVVHFDSTQHAIQAVAPMLNYNPAAIEILSDALVGYSKKNLATQHMCEWINGEPGSVQIVEFYDNDKGNIDVRVQAMFEELQRQSLGYAFDLYHEGETYRNVWSIRKRGLGLLLGEPNDERYIAFIEDAAIPVESLPEYIQRVQKICTAHGVDATYYAHASVGVIHVRPVLDMKVQSDIDKMKHIAKEVFKLVVEYGGAWSGEHGDGLVRSSFLREFFGDEIYQTLIDVKTLFDPNNIMNPGKIVHAPPMDQDLRYGANYKDVPFDSEYHYREQKSFHTAVHQCSGIGSCRKMDGGTMCPSFMATRDDAHSTRGRANALRLAMSGQLSDKGLADPVVLEAMDLCLSCKSCKAECPSSVDMARLKSEVLQVQYNTNGVPFRDRLVRDSTTMAKMISGPLAGIVNKVQGTTLFKSAFEKIAGIDKRRTLPSYAKESFSHWFKKHYRDQGHTKRVGIFADTYMNYQEPSIGHAAVKIIQALGYDIDILEGCCQRPRISHGFLSLAKKNGMVTCVNINNYEGDVIAFEPGCASALVDDLPDLIEDESIGIATKEKVITIEKWMEEVLTQQEPTNIKSQSHHIFLHGHCHQKALFGTEDIHRIFELLGATVTEPDSGCCGMGGSFGYEKEHYDISEKLANRVLIKALNDNPDALVVASGFSCRHQIAHFGKREVKHWIERMEVIDPTTLRFEGRGN